MVCRPVLLLPSNATRLNDEGDLVRISPNEVLTADPEVVRRMNAARSPYYRGKWYKHASPDAKTRSVFMETDMKRHDLLRGQLASGVGRFFSSTNKLTDI